MKKLILLIFTFHFAIGAYSSEIVEAVYNINSQTFLIDSTASNLPYSKESLAKYQLLLNYINYPPFLLNNSIYGFTYAKFTPDSVEVLRGHDAFKEYIKVGYDVCPVKFDSLIIKFQVMEGFCVTNHIITSTGNRNKHMVTDIYGHWAWGDINSAKTGPFLKDTLGIATYSFFYG